MVGKYDEMDVAKDIEMNVAKNDEMYVKMEKDFNSNIQNEESEVSEVPFRERNLEESIRNIVQLIQRYILNVT